MKKTAIVVVLIVILAIAGVPVLSGILMERTLKRSLSNISRVYSDVGVDFSFEIMEYNRKLYSSEILWKLDLGSFKSVYGFDEIIFKDKAHHGWTSVTSSTSLEQNRWFTDFLNKKLEGENPLEIETIFSYSGDYSTTMTLDSFTLPTDIGVLDVMPGELVFKGDMDLKKSSIKGTWEGISCQDKFLVSQLTINSGMKEAADLIWEGDFIFAAEKLQVLSEAHPLEVLNVKCEYSMDYDKDENDLSMMVEYGVGSILADRKEIKDAFVQAGVNHVDCDGYREFVKLYTRVMKNIVNEMPEGSGPGSEKASEEMKKQLASVGLQMVGAYEKLMKQGLEVWISGLKVQLPQGQVKGDFKLGLKKDMTIAQFAPVLMQPAAILDIFSLKSDIRLPYKLAGGNPNLLNPIYPGMQTGLFVKKGDDLIHNAEIRSGKLFLNGKELMLK